MIAIEDILKKTYNMKDLIVDVRKLYENNYKISDTQLDKLIDKITKTTKNKNSWLLSDDINYRLNLLCLITDKQKLAKSQLDSICAILFDENITNFEWIDNCYSYYNFDKTFLERINYYVPIDDVIKKGDIAIEELNRIILLSNPNNIDKIIKKIDDIYELEFNYRTYEILEKKGYKDFSFLMKYTKCNDPRILKILYNQIDDSSSIFRNFVEYAFENNLVKTVDDVDYIFNDFDCYYDSTFRKFEMFIKLIHKYNIIYSKIHIQNILKHNINPNIACQYNQIVSQRRFNLKFEIIYKFLAQNNVDQMAIFEYACLYCDIYCFDMLYEKIKKITQQCLLNACKYSNGVIIKKLIDHKLIPTIECYHAIERKSESIIRILLEYGLQLNDEILIDTISRGIYLDNLENYGYDHNINLLKICHRTKNYQYLKLLTKDSCSNIYEKILHNKDVKLIIDLTSNISPCEIIYELAFEKCNDELVNHLENIWNLKPTISALIRIDDFNKRQYYLEKLFMN